jgi:aspartate dehydrogenase
MKRAHVAVIGAGEIGSVVATALANNEVQGAALGAVVTRHHDPTSDWPQMSLDEALNDCDVVVECAGQKALADLGPDVIAAAKTLVATSAGALLEPSLMDLLDSGPGKWVCTSGAIGGLDILSAARRYGPYRTVSLTRPNCPDPYSSRG